MKWLEFLAKVANCVLVMVTGYEVGEMLLSSNSDEKYEKEMKFVRDFIEKASLKGITDEDIAEIKLAAYAIVGIVIAAAAFAIVFGFYFWCKRCATKTVQRALE